MIVNLLAVSDQFERVEVHFGLLEAICCKFARLIGLRVGSALDHRGQRRLDRFAIIISNFWYDATGAEPIDLDCYIADRSNELNCICAFETIYKMVDEMVASTLPEVVAELHTEVRNSM